ncbi:ATP-binding protein [Microbacterium rhizophilus]|uniref:ATP-binding protein n=1 Tax=Microbacterium rhizophilus TaxID=3138934 RepID=UPI0031E7E595
MSGEEEQYSLDGFAVPTEIDRLHTLLETVGADHPDIESMDLMLFETAVIEIANNVVEHGTPAGEVRWRFEVRVTDEEIVADLYDTGQEFSPTFGEAMPGEDAEGGRGLALAEAVLDELEVERTEEGNHWRMVRRLGQTSF